MALMIFLMVPKTLATFTAICAQRHVGRLQLHPTVSSA
jgi:hypothetical protein